MSPDREALIEAINSELDWDWPASLHERIPSSHEVLGEIADAVLAAGFHRAELTQQGAVNQAVCATLARRKPITDAQVDAAARVLARLGAVDWPHVDVWGGGWEAWRDRYHAKARAALEAAREAR